MDKQTVIKFLNNKYVFYFIVVMALSSFAGYILVEDYNSIVLFFGLAFLISRFTQNKTYILLIALLLTNLHFRANDVVEGFKGKKGKKSKGKKGGMKDEESEEEESEEEESEEEEEESESEEEEEEEVKKENFQSKQKIVKNSRPAKINREDDLEIGEDEHVDYASTLQQAYKNMESMLGKGGMKGLTKETKKLVQQQKELMTTLNEMTPVLADAKKTLSTMNMPDMGSLQKMMGKMSAMK